MISNWAMGDKQEVSAATLSEVIGRDTDEQMIDVIETVYRGASKGRGLVVAPKGELLRNATCGFKLTGRLFHTAQVLDHYLPLFLLLESWPDHRWDRILDMYHPAS
jgi:hypothetical protein